ncbi:MFS transporter [Streptomyces sp. SCSIO ZS0520]|uniref:MFS transporter n=1 Tax=Streptomyces sp. SCSIO ZS0520 TaxID=2892996 RepID=UPI00398679C4
MPLLNKTLPAAREATARGLLRPRTALTVFFALDGFVFAGWVVRIPAIKEQTGASVSALGLALLGVSAGAVLTMTLTGRLCARYGSHRVTAACGVLLPLSVALPPLTHSALALGLVLLLFGAAYGGINVAMNSAAVDLVRALGRPVMPSFHAAFSLGGMAGAGLGSLVAGELTPTRHLSALAAAGLLITALAAPSLRPSEPPGPPPADAQPRPATAPERTTTAPAPRGGLPSGRARSTPKDRSVRGVVLVLGLVALCTAYGEGALADWSALHLEQDLGAHPGVAAAGFSCFALAMTLGRLSGRALLERFGPTRTVVGGGALASAGMFLGALAPSTAAVFAGFAVTGLGLANIFPVAVERAGALAGPSGVATASTLGYGGMLLGPPAIGFMAGWFSLPVALTSVAALAALAAVIAAAAARTAPAGTG